VLAPNAKLRALVVPQEAEAPAQATQPAECEAHHAHRRPVRLSWATLLKLVFEIDMEHCPNCGGELKIIAAILEQPVIEKILTHLGLQARAPPRATARDQALQAEPGHKQSGGLFVPGEESGHWPDAPCKGPDAAQPRQFRRPSDQGRWSRLRPRVCAIYGSALVIRDNPRTKAGKDDFQRRSQCSTVPRHFQRPLTSGEGRVRGAKGAGKGRLKILSSSA